MFSFFLPLLSALNLRWTLSAGVYASAYLHHLSLLLISLFRGEDGHTLRFASLRSSPHPHPYVLLQVSASDISPSLIHLTLTHLIFKSPIPSSSSYQCVLTPPLPLFFHLPVSCAVPPELCPPVPPFFSRSAFKLFLSQPPPHSHSHSHPLNACSHALLPLHTCHRAASQALR